MNEESVYETLSLVVIDKPYLMVTFIPCYVASNGSIWLEQGWHHDLIEHLNYLPYFTLCAPKIQKGNQPNLKELLVPEGVHFRYVVLPSRASSLEAFFGLPKTLIVVWQAIGQAEIIHSSVIGWPYPLGWIVNPIAVIRRKSLIIVVESSWRTNSPLLLGRVWDTAKELAARWSCRHSAAAFFTQAAYRDTLYRGSPGRAHVTPAIWINDADIMNEEDARRCWEQKSMNPVKMLFAGRLVAAKGVLVLLQALKILDERKAKVIVDIVGEGALRQDCRDAASQMSNIHLSILDQVPYGPPFFELVRGYHILLIPSLSDEQPRVVFDANAQAVPVIASNTPGLRPHVEDRLTGWLIQQGSPESLAAAIESVMADQQNVGIMGMAALASTRGHTHVAMHQQRSQILKKQLSTER